MTMVTCPCTEMVTRLMPSKSWKTQRRVGRDARLPDLVGEGVVVMGQLVSHPALGNGVDQQRQGHHHQETLEPRRLFDEERRHKKHGVLEEAEAALPPRFALCSPRRPLHRSGR